MGYELHNQNKGEKDSVREKDSEREREREREKERETEIGRLCVVWECFVSV